ncbi:MAG: FmdB family zinc ribbon protein [Thermodesulfobacteriota bacterium]
MPIYDYVCRDCGQNGEFLVTGNADTPSCGSCGSSRMQKQLSAPSSFSGRASSSMPGPGDTACCGETPGHSGCAGPGSCCGKA